MRRKSRSVSDVPVKKESWDEQLPGVSQSSKDTILFGFIYLKKRDPTITRDMIITLIILLLLFEVGFFYVAYILREDGRHTEAVYAFSAFQLMVAVCVCIAYLEENYTISFWDETSYVNNNNVWKSELEVRFEEEPTHPSEERIGRNSLTWYQKKQTGRHTIFFLSSLLFILCALSSSIIFVGQATLTTPNRTPLLIIVSLSIITFFVALVALWHIYFQPLPIQSTYLRKKYRRFALGILFFSILVLVGMLIKTGAQCNRYNLFASLLFISMYAVYLFICKHVQTGEDTDR